MSDVKRFVKLQNQYFEVVLEDGMRLKPVDTMEYLASSVEKTVLGNEAMGLAEDEDNVMQQVIDQTRDELMKTLKQGIKETVLGILGFEKNSWGERGFKVDHCNGRMSSVTDLISHELKQELLKVQISPEFLLTDEERQELREAMRKDFAQRYHQEVSRQSYSAIQRLAESDVKEVCNQLLGSKKQDIAGQVLESLLKSKKK